MVGGERRMKVYCPYCGTYHIVTRREKMYLDLNGYCANMCAVCRQVYFFDGNATWKEKEKRV